MEKWCSRGKHWQDASDFYPRNGWCKTCKSTYNRQVYNFSNTKKRRYKVRQSTMTYQTFLLNQEGKCAVCSNPKKLFIDSTSDGTPHALLCTTCQSIVGKLNDNDYRFRINAYMNEKEMSG